VDISNLIPGIAAIFLVLTPKDYRNHVIEFMVDNIKILHSAGSQDND
jgi:hypothetical protein